MPVPMLREMSEEAGVTLETAEKRWEEAKQIVKKQYPKITENSKHYWELVVGVTRHSLGIKKKPKKTSKEGWQLW